MIKQRYRVTHIEHAADGYAAFRAVDIENREKTEYLLNVYEGELIKQFIGCFDRLKNCPEFIDMFMADGMLVALFALREGASIDRLFYKGADIDWKVRMHYAQLLFHLGLCVYTYPPEIGCAALLSRNIVLHEREQTLSVNYVIEPCTNLNARELTFLVSDQIKKVLLKRFSSPNAELQLLTELDKGMYQNAKELYAYWVRIKDELRQEYEKIYNKNTVARALYLVFLNLGRWAKRVFKKKR